MFAVAICIADRYQNRIASYGKLEGTPSWKYDVDNFILKNYLLYLQLL